MLWALVNEHGLCEGALDMDARSAAAHPLRPGERLLEVGHDDHNALKFLGHAARYEPGLGWHLLPHEHVRAWNRARGHSWAHVLDAHKQHVKHVEALAAAGMLEGLAPCPEDLPLPPAPDDRRRYAVPALEVRPGLWIREMTKANSLDFAEQLVAAQLYEEPDDLTRIRVAEWYHSDLCWPMVVTWKGEPIEFEAYHFYENRPGVVHVSFNVRLRRDRPYRFWREVFRSFFEILKSLGITTIESRVRADRPDYIEGLVQTYGAQRLGGDGAWTNLRYSLDRAIALGQGWPDRATAGAAWRWTEGDLEIREASAEDLAALPDALGRQFRFMKGGGRARQILEDWTALDGAAVVLGTVDGELRYARAIRQRSPGVAAWASLLPFYDEPAQATAARGFAAWARAAGFAKGTTFVPRAQYEHPAIQAHLSRQPHRLVRVLEDGEQLHELEFDF